MPDDEYIEKGKYGIDFNRAKPSLQEALQYKKELPQGYKWINSTAFAAGTKDEHESKSRTWDSFYAYIWDKTPQILWVAPHSGSVDRPPDDVLRFPKLMIDNFTTGAAALCAFKGKNQPSKRILMAIHSTGHLGAVLNLGDFGILDPERLKAVSAKLESKYSRRVQVLANKFKRDFGARTMAILQSIIEKRGILIPEVLERFSDDYLTVRYYEKGLRFYGQEIKEYTTDEFRRAIENLGKLHVPVISVNLFYTGRNVGKSLKLSEKINQGLMDSALVIEGARLYMAKDPELVSDIILDVKRELSG
jgi:hypothetical protein